MNFRIRSFITVLQVLGLACVSVLTLSCGGGGAAAGNSALPVLRSYSGTVQNGTLTLTDPQTQASVQITGGVLPDGSNISLQVHSGKPTFFTPSQFVVASETFSVTLPVKLPANSTGTIAFTIPDIPIHVPSVHGCALFLDPSQPPYMIQPSQSATSGMLTCTVPLSVVEAYNLHYATLAGQPFYLTVQEFGLPSSTKARASSRNPSLYVYRPSTKTVILNNLTPNDVQGKRLCILMHGLTQGALNSSVVSAAQYLGGLSVVNSGNATVHLYDYVLVGDYDTWASIQDNAESFDAQLQPFVANASSCDMVGYSMGGLILRWCIEKATMPLAQYHPRLITIGTPHRGVPFALFLEVSNVFLLGNIPQGLFDLRDPIDPGSTVPFIGQLNAPPFPTQLDYYSVAGNTWFESDESGSALLFPASVTYASLYLLIPSPVNDGIVGDYSANWIGLGDRSSSWKASTNYQSKEVAQNHFGLIDSIRSSNSGSVSIESYLLKGIQVTIQ